MPAITVLLRVTVDENGDGEFGAFDSRTVPQDVAAFTEDYLIDLTRKEHESPWRVTNVELVNG
jgi:hypothetical protein